MCLLLCLFVVTGCEEDFDPVGSYTGDVHETAFVETSEVELGDNPSVDNRTFRNNDDRSGVRVSVRNHVERRFEVVLDTGCVLSMRQAQANPRSAEVDLSQQEPCPIDVQGYSGPVLPQGSARFGRDTRGLELTLSGIQHDEADMDGFEGRTADVAWSYTFNTR